MTSIGGLLAVLGFGSLILPIFGLQFRMLSLIQGAQPWLGILLGVAGIALLAVGFMQNQNEGQQQQAQQPYPPQGQQPQQ